MLGSRLARNVRAALALLTLSAFLAGCSSWQPLETPYAASLSARHPSEVRVTRDDSTSVRLYDPVVNADSLIGRSTRRLPGDRVALSLSRSTRIDVRQSDPLPTTLLAVGGGLAIVLLIVAVAAGTQGTFY